MDEFTSRIEELNSKFSARKVSSSQQNLAMQAEACVASMPTSLFVSGIGNSSSTGSLLPNSLSSSQLVKESPFMEEILLIARGQRQIMHQIDNLSNLLHEYFGERSHQGRTSHSDGMTANRGCKAIYASGGATCVLLRDGMTRAPVVRFASAKRAADLKFFLEDPLNFDTLSVVFNKSSRFARIQGIRCAIAGKNLYIRFSCSTGDAMGMNMVSKGVQNVLDFLVNDFPDMEVIGISGNFCADKKPAAVNWIEGRGKSVVCEAVISESVVAKVLKTSVSALVELNMLKNLAGSAIAGALGGFNAHAANIVSAVFIATGQDPAQNIESSHCLTMMEAVNNGKDLHVSVTMPSIEVGTIGGGTQLASQSACLNLLGVKGASKESPGSNSQLLAAIVAGSVLAGELSLMSAIAAGQLIKSHMKYNRSSRDITKIGS